MGEMLRYTALDQSGMQGWNNAWGMGALRPAEMAVLTYIHGRDALVHST